MRCCRWSVTKPSRCLFPSQDSRQHHVRPSSACPHWNLEKISALFPTFLDLVKDLWQFANKLHCSMGSFLIRLCRPGSPALTEDPKHSESSGKALGGFLSLN
jgi:hypothetical protein